MKRLLSALVMIPMAYYLPDFGRSDMGVSTLVYPAALISVALLILWPVRGRCEEPRGVHDARDADA